MANDAKDGGASDLSSLKIADLTGQDLSNLISTEIARHLSRAGVGAVHANSGPPGHENVPGHANFDPKQILGGGIQAGRQVHVNSGPPGHENVPGHANFDPKQILTGGIQAGRQVHVNSGPPGHENVPGHANFDPKQILGGGIQAGRQVHVNSGPPGHENVPGHANFDPKQIFGGAIDRVRSHVNSGPPGHENVPGHANFDPRQLFDRGVLAGRKVHVNSGPPGHNNTPGPNPHFNFTGGGPKDPRPQKPLSQHIVTLANGTRVSLPAEGPIDVMVGDVRIKR